ncbi:MAG TPA: AAA family ATPase [Patescibacteria group bacterium]|nr:AAA family ATPase [Patescibacteria group bacterium]
MKGSNPHIYFITGASGVGKTTLVSQLEGKYRNKPGWLFLHFDAMGVPSKDEMKSEYGSEENWQKETTQTWVQKMLTEHQDKTVIIFEGQVNLNFIKDSFKAHDFFDYTTVLIDCNKSIVRSRLVEERMQPELATDIMDNWRDLLRKQAQELAVDIIDTNIFNRDESVAVIERIFQRDGFL